MNSIADNKHQEVKLIEIDQGQLRQHVDGLVKDAVEDTLNVMLDATRVSPSTVSELDKKIYARIYEWRNRPIMSEHPYIYLDGVWLNPEFGGEVKPVAVPRETRRQLRAYLNWLRATRGAAAPNVRKNLDNT